MTDVIKSKPSHEQTPRTLNEAVFSWAPGARPWPDERRMFGTRYILSIAIASLFLLAIGLGQT